MSTNYNTHTLQTTYESLLDFISADKNRINLCKDIINVWKTTDEPFLQMITIFFQTENAIALFPTFILYSNLVEQFQNQKEPNLLNWLKDFNRVFLVRIKNEMNQTTLCSSNDGAYDDNKSFIEDAFLKCTHIFKGLQLKNQELETEVQLLKKELNDSKMQVGYFVSSVGRTFDEEEATFRKRVRSRISKLSNP
jgi:hypothetical protein